MRAIARDQVEVMTPLGHDRFGVAGHDRGGRCACRMLDPGPVHALWDQDGTVQAWYEPLEIWRQWAQDVRGKALWGGHFLAEENPKEVASELIHFFAEPALTS
jgi:hypothetical protein